MTNDYISRTNRNLVAEIVDFTPGKNYAGLGIPLDVTDMIANDNDTNWKLVTLKGSNYSFALPADKVETLFHQRATTTV